MAAATPKPSTDPWYAVWPRSESYGWFVAATVIAAAAAMLWLSTSASAACYEAFAEEGQALSIPDEPPNCRKILDPPDAATNSTAPSEHATETEAHAAHLIFVSLMTLAIATAVGGAVMALHLASEPADAYERRTFAQRMQRSQTRTAGWRDFAVGTAFSLIGGGVIVGMLAWNPTDFNILWNPYGWDNHLTEVVAVLIGFSAVSVAVIVGIGHRVAHTAEPSLRHLLNAKWASTRLFAVFAATLSFGVLAMVARWRMAQYLPGGEPVPGIVAVLYGALFSLVLAALAFPTQARLNVSYRRWVHGESGGTDVQFSPDQLAVRKAIREELAPAWGDSSVVPSSLSVAGPLITAAATAFFG